MNKRNKGGFFQTRTLRFESLENRELLSVTPGSVDAEALESQGFSETNKILVTTLADVEESQDGLISLREAIRYANNTGTAIEFSVGGTVFLKKALEISKSVSINSNGLETIALDGQGLCRIGRFSGADVSIRVNNISFQNGSADQGGALYVASGTAVEISYSRFYSNTATGAGGAIYILGSGMISGTEFSENEAVNGGAISIASSSSSRVQIDNSSFEENQATELGGAISILPSPGTELEVCRIDSTSFSGNQAKSGGAIYTSDGTLTLVGSTFSENDATNQGGAICVKSNGLTSTTLYAETTQFLNNQASSAGGAIYNASYLESYSNHYHGNKTTNSIEGGGGAINNGASLTSIGDRFSSNTSLGNSPYGDGGALRNESAGACLLLNAQFEFNTASNAGGGIFNLGDLEVRNSTFTGNATSSPSLGTGGGLANEGSLVLLDSLLSENTSGRGGALSVQNTGTGTVERCSFFGNVAGVYSEQSGYGGAIVLGPYGELVIKDSILNANTAWSGGAIYSEAGGNVGGESYGFLTLSGSYIRLNLSSSQSEALDATNGYLDNGDNSIGGNSSTMGTAIEELVLRDSQGKIVTGTIDFGVVAQQTEPLTKTYTIENMGNEIINLPSLDSWYSIETTAPAFSWSSSITGGLSLAPGESSQISISLTRTELGSKGLVLTWRSGNQLFRIQGMASVVEGAALLSKTNITLNEAENEAEYSIALSAAPLSEVRLLLTAGAGVLFVDSTGALSSTFELRFTPSNWNQSQSVSIRRDEKALTAADIPLVESIISHSLITDLSLTDENVSPICREMKIPDLLVSFDPYVIAVPGEPLPDTIPAGTEILKRDMLPSFSVCQKTFGDEQAILSLSLSANNISSPISLWQIEWGDGTRDLITRSSCSLTKSHYYRTMGDYNISLTVYGGDRAGTGVNTIFIANHTVLAPPASSSLPREERALPYEAVSSILSESELPGSESLAVFDSSSPMVVPETDRLLWALLGEVENNESKRAPFF